MQNKITLNDFQITLQRKTSPNGLKFVHFKKASAPISIKICSRSGSRFDPKDKSGLAHFVEHIILDGTEKYPNKKELSLSFDDLGGSYGAVTGPEYTRFDFLVAKKEHLNLVADVINQIFNKPLLEDKNVELEKKIIKTEISSKLDNNKRVLSNNIKKLIYGDNQLATNISGTEESVMTITKDDLVAHLKDTFQQDMTVVSCGDCEIEEITSLLEPILPHKNQSVSLDAPNVPSGLKYGAYNMSDQKLVYCMFAFPTSGIASSDDVALNVLATYLGKGRSSLLKELLRYDEGLLYSVTAGNNRFSDTGYFFIETGVKKENMTIVFNKIKAALETLAKDGIAQESLNSIKNKIVNAGIISTQTVQFWTETQFYRELLIRDNNYCYTDFLNDIAVIDKPSVDRVISKYLTTDKMFFYAVGNVTESEVQALFS
jgi:zinc protease